MRRTKGAKFKEGDKVRVYRKIDSPFGWNPKMDSVISKNKYYIVKDSIVSGNGTRGYILESSSFSWPEGCLQKKKILGLW